MITAKCKVHTETEGVVQYTVQKSMIMNLKDINMKIKNGNLNTGWNGGSTYNIPHFFLENLKPQETHMAEYNSHH